MGRRKIIIPSEYPGGLDAAPSEHFGLCAMFTTVILENGVIASVTSNKNTHILCRNCFSPIKYLLENGMDVLLVNRLGLFPFRVLEGMRIPVYYFSGYRQVRGVLDDFLHGRLRRFTHDDTCNGDCEL